MDDTLDQQDARVIAGRYTVGSVLGTGGMSVVHDGFDQRLMRPVAIKQLTPQMAERDDVRSRFETEARWAARLQHPHAVAVYDTGEDAGMPFLVMERLPGETLGDRIAQGPVDPEWLRRVAIEVLGALQAAHDCRIVHRDIKPGNILLTASGHAKVADFGIAKSLGLDADRLDLTHTGQLIGTPSYLAPERLDGAPAEVQSDIYSLGVVMYEALTGRKPFTGPDALAAAYAIKHSDVVPLAELRPDAPSDLVSVVERAMAREPDARFATARDMAASLRGRLGASAGTAAVGNVGAIEGTQVLTGVGAPFTGAADAGPTVLTSDPALPSWDETAAPRPGRVRSGRGWLPVAVIALVLLLIGALFTLGRGTGGSGGSGAGDRALASDIREVANRVEVGDGSKGPEAAERLRSIADKVENGDDAAGDAQDLISDTRAWNDERLLFDTATAKTVEVLSRVPGVSGGETSSSEPSTTVTTSAPVLSTPVVEVPAARDRGKRGKHDD